MTREELQEYRTEYLTDDKWGTPETAYDEFILYKLMERLPKPPKVIGDDDYEAGTYDGFNDCLSLVKELLTIKDE